MKKFVKCESPGQFLAYLYGELNGAALNAFEDHLSDCTTCIDEFAEIADLRYSVYEWRKVEFDPLETPVFSIEAIETPPSWSEQFQAWFGQHTQWLSAASAFGAVVIVLTIGILFYSAGDTADLAAVDDPSLPAVIVTPERASGTPVGGLIEDEAEEAKPSASAFDERRNLQQPKTSARKTPSRQPASPAVTVSFRSVPRLNEFEDIQDDGLRLADMFDDIGSSE
ncbi:MAG: hypothetical protein H0V76_03985 [Blastocatellia bacterium]|nr:hypothetical protein [Blastocatellia bacterium]